MTANLQEETADRETASAGYAQRFAGPAGTWMLRVQGEVVCRWLESERDATILDVGGGHGQLAAPLAARGYRVTVLGSAACCAERLRPEIDAGRVRFVEGPLLALPWSDGTFDVVVCIRLLPHCAEWRRLVAELCRVARRRVIVDYPTGRSLNALSPVMSGMKRKVEGNTRPYALFGHGEVAAEFARHGFPRVVRYNEFFLPMVLHRMLKRPALSAGLERACRSLGLTAALGSPVLANFSREEKP